MKALVGADIILPDRIVTGGTLVLEDERIAAVLSRADGDLIPSADRVLLDGHLIAPGFIDVHVHGVEGWDTLDGGVAIAEIAARLPRYGVTAFCPTSVACSPASLRDMLVAVRAARTTPAPGSRVLPAHLESNFINPEYKGAQPAPCLRRPPASLPLDMRFASSSSAREFSAEEVLREIAAARPDVGIITLAPELPGALELIAALVSNGHRVSLGHSGATYEQAMDAIDRGARHATHLFNRMPPVSHRAPGLAGAVLSSEEIAAEIICDGVHVHPAMVRSAIAAKQTARVMAITDGTAGSGLPRGSRARLGGQEIGVRDGAAWLVDGTLAGSVLTMDGAFRVLATACGLPLVDIATVCSTTPARELGLNGFGVIAEGAVADLVVLSHQFEVVQTWIAGQLVYSAP
jgi:N-acetylglucosamine-6-phosphate deacetylase